MYSNNYIRKQFPNDLRGSACLCKACVFGLLKQLQELLCLAKGTKKLPHVLFCLSFPIPSFLPDQHPVPPGLGATDLVCP